MLYYLIGTLPVSYHILIERYYPAYNRCFQCSPCSIIHLSIPCVSYSGVMACYRTPTINHKAEDGTHR